MKKDIIFIKTCESCQINKKDSKSNKVRMVITTISERPFQKIAIDIVGFLPVTENRNKFIFTLQDDLTKFSYGKSIPNHEAITVASNLLTFITIFGIPETIFSDQVSDFTSVILKELNKLLKIKHVLSRPYHSQTTEINVKLAMFIYNTHIHKSTSFTPFELIFGHKAIIPSSLTSNLDFKYSYDDYYSNLKLKFNGSYKIARENLIKSKEKSKLYYDAKARKENFQVGNLVLLQNKQVKQALNKKLSSNFKGPFKIIKINENKTAQLEVKPNKFVAYHFNLLKPFFPGEQDHD